MRIAPLQASASSKLLPYILVLIVSLCSSCGEKKQEPPTASKPESHNLAGDWQSEIESAGRVVTGSAYRIEETRDTVAVELVSTKSPSGDELVPGGMWFRAKGTWQSGALRLVATSWVSGRDTCSFQLRGDMDKEGRLLLHFPADLCGEKSLPYTRVLHRPAAAGPS